ncbi:MAG: class II aldolase/adducin family protein [Gammaproteobacteria bacterium]
MIKPQDVIKLSESLFQNTEACLRKQLCYLYHAIDYFGWCDLIFTHLSVRLPGTDTFLFNPFGLSFSEITPDNIVKVNFNGEVDSPDGWPINKNGSKAHIAIYKARPDVQCIIHTHSKATVAISNLDVPVMGLDQITMFLHSNVSYHGFERLFTFDDEQKQMVSDLGKNDFMILNNHGSIALGDSVPRAFWNYYYLQFACETQLMSLSSGAKLKNPPDEIKLSTGEKYKEWKKSHSILPPDDVLLFLATIRKMEAARAK